MTKEKKAMNTKLYAVIVFFLMAGFLAGVTVGTYTNKYNGFDPEKVALAYAESIVNRGDGYNAYKNTVMSKNYKYGDYIREYYMYPVIYRDCADFEILGDREALKGYNDESYKSETTINDDGELSGKVIDTMYPFYKELMETYSGWDDYDCIFTEYFNKLVEVRTDIFGDKYMTDEIMFTALESNVKTYGDSLTGTEEDIDSTTGVKISEKTIGEYEKVYGENYKLSCSVVSLKAVEDLDEYKSFIDKAKIKTYGISLDDIEEAKKCIIEVKANGSTVVKSLEVYVVRINSTWYVDNTKTYTYDLYEFYK